MLLLDERTNDRGGFDRVYLAPSERGLALVLGDAADAPVLEIPSEALVAVLERYGKPLADGIAATGPGIAFPLAEPAAPPLEGAESPAESRADSHATAALRRLRHRALYDVCARDYLVLERPGKPPLAELATAVTGALVHLAKAISRAPSS